MYCTLRQRLFSFRFSYMQFPERERPFLQRWRDLAIEKERQLSQRRTEQLRELQKYVASRLSQLEVCDNTVVGVVRN